MTRTVLIKGVRYRVREQSQPESIDARDEKGRLLPGWSMVECRYERHDPWYVRLWRWYCYRSNGWRVT